MRIVVAKCGLGQEKQVTCNLLRIQLVLRCINRSSRNSVQRQFDMMNSNLTIKFEFNGFIDQIGDEIVQNVDLSLERLRLQTEPAIVTLYAWRLREKHVA